jgi:hypothetical protein
VEDDDMITELDKPSDRLVLGEVLDAVKAGLEGVYAMRCGGDGGDVADGGLLCAVAKECWHERDLLRRGEADPFDGECEARRLVVICESEMNRGQAARLLRQLADRLEVGAPAMELEHA